MDARLPPLPPKPDLEARPKPSKLWMLMAGFAALGLVALLAFLVMPILWVGIGIAAIIGLQYLLWGWWFERIYRSPPGDEAIQAEIIRRQSDRSDRPPLT